VSLGTAQHIALVKGRTASTLKAGDCWSFSKGFDSLRKHQLSSNQAPVTTVRGPVPDLEAVKQAVNAGLAAGSPPTVDTSGTPETRPDALGHNMMVLAQGVEP
jgi:hypothetical protein